MTLLTQNNALRTTIVYNSNSKKTLVRTIQDDYTTDDELSITERCDKSIRHSSLVWQTGAIVDTATHSTHNSLVVSQTNASLDNANIYQLRLHLHVKLDVVTLRHKMTKVSSDQTDVYKLCHKVTKKNIMQLVSRHLTSLQLSSPLFASLRRTNNNKHNDIVNLHAQNCCTQNSIIKLIQKSPKMCTNQSVI